MASSKKSGFPITEPFGGTEVTFRIMTGKDEEEVLRFANMLPESDLKFLRLDITQPEVVSEWIKNIKNGRTRTILAEEDGGIVGYGSLHYNQTYWTRHIGEIRMMVIGKLRGLGVGRALVTKLHRLAKNEALERVIVQIAADQPKVRMMFEDLRFEPEAILSDWLRDREGRTHDLLIMSQDVLA